VSSSYDVFSPFLLMFDVLSLLVMFGESSSHFTSQVTLQMRRSPAQAKNFGGAGLIVHAPHPIRPGNLESVAACLHFTIEVHPSSSPVLHQHQPCQVNAGKPPILRGASRMPRLQPSRMMWNPRRRKRKGFLLSQSSHLLPAQRPSLRLSAVARSKGIMILLQRHSLTL